MKETSILSLRENFGLRNDTLIDTIRLPQEEGYKNLRYHKSPIRVVAYRAYH